MICPKTFKPCIDDICYAGGCMLLQGEPMLERCPGCGAIVSSDEIVGETCSECPEDGDYGYD